jgi:hypothetical protein
LGKKTEVPNEKTEFEKLAERLKIPEPLWLRSRTLREFARRNVNSKYVPEKLLESWGITPSESV